MRRREVIALIGAALAWPPRVGAQAERMRRIGVLMSWAADDPESLARVGAFRDALEKLGWTEGRNLLLEIRWARSDAGVDAGLREGTRRFAAGYNLVSHNADDLGTPSAYAGHSCHLRGRFRSGRQWLRVDIQGAGRKRHGLHRRRAHDGR